MRLTVSAGIAAAALLLAGCGSSNELTVGGLHGEEGGSMRGAANALRNRAAAMGGNVLYGITRPSQKIACRITLFNDPMALVVQITLRMSAG